LRAAIDTPSLTNDQETVHHKRCLTDWSRNDAVIAFVRHHALMTSRRGALTLHDMHRPLVPTNADSFTAAEEATQ
jgi:hypothetical protein